MKEASENLKNDQIKIYQRHWKQVLMYRVEWNPATNIYEWESEPVDLENYLIKVNPIKWKLDTEGLNIWKVSNVTIEVKNHLNHWSPDNSIGIFGYGKSARGSKIVVKAGNYLDDETKELLYVFTGVIDQDLEFDPLKKSCRIPVTSLDFLLQRSNAENVSTTTYDLFNGNLTEYTTTNYGVGIIKKVTVSSVEKFPGKDFSISQLNDPDQGAKITFPSPTPPGTNNVRIDYIYWFQDKTIDWLVEELVKEANLTDYQIDPAIFDNFIAGEWEQTTTADFNAGTPYHVNTADDKVILTNTNKSLFGGTVVIENGGLLEGSWGNIKDDNVDTYARLLLLPPPYDNFYVGLEFASLEGIFKLEIVQKAYSGYTGYPLLVDFYYNNSWHLHTTIYLTTDKETIDFFYPLSYVKKIRLRTQDSEVSFYLYELRAFGYYTSGYLLSQTKNLTGDLVSYGKLDYTRTVPTETSLIIKTQSSPNGSDWEAETELGDNQQVLSTPQQYFRWKAYFDNNSTYKSPTLFDVTLNYYLSDLKIELANFTGMDCYTAIKQLASFVDYEIGFDSQGKFFFRSKETINPSVLNLSDIDDKLVKLYNLKVGWDWVYNWIEANYGSYTKYENPIDREETRPHSIDKYGFRKLTLSGGQLLIDNEVDIATGIARRYYGKFDISGNLVKYFYPTPKYMCNALIKFLPQLDLSDVVSVEYLGEVDGRDWIFKFDSWTFDNWKFSPYPVLTMRDFKIIGISLDTEKFNVTLDLRELD